MAESYVQTNTTATFDVGCSGATAAETTPAAVTAEIGGTVGTTQLASDWPFLSGGSRAGHVIVLPAPGAADWDGTWTIPLNITACDAGDILEDVHLCDWDGSTTYVSAATPASNGSGFTHTRGATGVVTATITVDTYTLQSTTTSQPFIVLVWGNNDTHGGAGSNITPDQTITAPFTLSTVYENTVDTADGVATASASDLYLRVVVPSSGNPAGTSTTAVSVTVVEGSGTVTQHAAAPDGVATTSVAMRVIRSIAAVALGMAASVVSIATVAGMAATATGVGATTVDMAVVRSAAATADGVSTTAVTIVPIELGGTAYEFTAVPDGLATTAVDVAAIRSLAATAGGLGTTAVSVTSGATSEFTVAPDGLATTAVDLAVVRAIDANAVLVFSEYGEENHESEITVTSQDRWRCAQTFTASVDGVLDTATFYLNRTGSPPNNLTAQLFAVSGTVGAGLPTGSPLAESAPVVASSLLIDPSIATQVFDFSGDPYELTAGTVYAIGIEYNDGNLSNFVGVGSDPTAPTHPGRQAVYNGSWVAGSADTIFTATAAAKGPAGVASVAVDITAIRAAQELAASADGLASTAVDVAAIRSLAATADGVASTTVAVTAVTPGSTVYELSAAPNGVGTPTATMYSVIQVDMGAVQGSATTSAAFDAPAGTSYNLSASPAGVGTASTPDLFLRVPVASSGNPAGVGAVTVSITAVPGGGPATYELTAPPVGVGVATATQYGIKQITLGQITGVAVTTVSLTVVTPTSLAAQVDGVSTATGTPYFVKQMTLGDIAGVATTTVSIGLISATSLTTQADGVGSTTVDLAVVRALAAIADGSSATTVSITAVVPGVVVLATSADGVASTTVDLAVVRALAAGADGVTSTSVDLAVVRSFSTSADGTSTTIAGLLPFGITEHAATADGAATASVSVGVRRSLAANADGTATVTVAVTPIYAAALTAVPTGIATTSVDIATVRAFAATADGAGTLNVRLSSTAIPEVPGKYAVEHAQAYRDVLAVEQGDFTREHANAYADVLKAGV